MSRQAVISAAVAPVHKQPAFSSEMITQAMLWENIQIMATNDNWYKICMEDGYDGWIHSFYLQNRDPAPEEYIFVTKRAVPVFHEINKTSSIRALLSFGTYVPMEEHNGAFCKICLPDGRPAYIEFQEQVEVMSREAIIELAISLLGVPYLWGGKSSFGYDCSGFVQMVLKTTGINVQRDTSKQIETKDLKKIHIDVSEPGDLIFFAENNRINHVAFILGEGKIIHCSGQVKIESILEGEQGFSKHLSQYKKAVMSIGGIISS